MDETLQRILANPECGKLYGLGWNSEENVIWLVVKAAGSCKMTQVPEQFQIVMLIILIVPIFDRLGTSQIETKHFIRYHIHILEIVITMNRILFQNI